jgi:hypothetical protein
MAVVLVWNGPGTLFPIALAAGGALILVVTVFGVGIGRRIRASDS